MTDHRKSAQYYLERAKDRNRHLARRTLCGIIAVGEIGLMIHEKLEELSNHTDAIRAHLNK